MTDERIRELANGAFNSFCGDLTNGPGISSRPLADALRAAVDEATAETRKHNADMGAKLVEMIGERDELLAECDALRDLLRELQDRGPGGSCPMCGYWEACPPDCRLAAELAKHSGGKQP